MGTREEGVSQKGSLISLSPIAYSDGQGWMRDYLGERDVGNSTETNQKARNGVKGKPHTRDYFVSS